MSLVIGPCFLGASAEKKAGRVPLWPHSPPSHASPVQRTLLGIKEKYLKCTVIAEGGGVDGEMNGCTFLNVPVSPDFRQGVGHYS